MDWSITGWNALLGRDGTAAATAPAMPPSPPLSAGPKSKTGVRLTSPGVSPAKLPEKPLQGCAVRQLFPAHRTSPMPSTISRHSRPAILRSRSPALCRGAVMRPDHLCSCVVSRMPPAFTSQLTPQFGIIALQSRVRSQSLSLKPLTNLRHGCSRLRTRSETTSVTFLDPALHTRVHIYDQVRIVGNLLFFPLFW